MTAALPLAAAPVIPTFGGGSKCAANNGTFCWDWFTAHWGDTFGPALQQHVLLVIIAVGIGFPIALAASLLAYRTRLIELPTSGFFTLLYTIPSIALFELLVPATGLNNLTAEIALVSYTLLVMFTNFVAGLRAVPDDVRESAEGMGLTRMQRLRHVELPLAIPAMVAGVRVATVTVISLATVAAFVNGGKGLGGPIIDGINLGTFKTELIAAGALAVLLAWLADAVLVIAQRVLTPWSRGERSKRRRWRWRRARSAPTPAPA